ncbi:armadillo repeat-containing protein 1-like [Hetaerina americana]|uniref:armadillo repeat-containing protein 1-like n=1 Tax=Hetaerina americana TaxID=62018 RepID=UPI003A7F2B7F
MLPKIFVKELGPKLLQMDKNTDNILNTVRKYKSLAANPVTQSAVVKDITCLQFLAYILDNPNEEVLEEALEAFKLLIDDKSNHFTLLSVFGVLESLDSLAERCPNDKLAATARELHQNLKSSDPAALKTVPPIHGRSCGRWAQRTEDGKDNTQKLTAKTITLHIHGLSPETRLSLERAIVSLPGVVSLMVDIEHQRCVLRARPFLELETVAKAITETECLEAKLVSRNKLKQEILLPMGNKRLSPTKSTSFSDMDRSESDPSLPDYLPEEEGETPIKDNAISLLGSLRQNASGWIHSATSFLHQSFYW